MPPVGAVPHVVRLAGGGGLVAAAGELAALVPQRHQAAQADRDVTGLPGIQRQGRPAQALAQQVTALAGASKMARRSAPAVVIQAVSSSVSAALIERYVTRTVRVKKGRRRAKKQVQSAVAVFSITSLDAREAAPVHLAGYVRGQRTR